MKDIDLVKLKFEVKLRKHASCRILTHRWIYRFFKVRFALVKGLLTCHIPFKKTLCHGEILKSSFPLFQCCVNHNSQERIIYAPFKSS